MADLNPLIRVRKHAVEQKQKFVAELYRQAEELTAQKQRFLDQLAEEKEKIKNANSVEMLRFFNNYSKSVKARVKDVDQSIRQLEKRIETAREDMREAFAEFKKIEITQARREEEKEAALNKKEAIELDEMAIDGFRRRDEE